MPPLTAPANPTRIPHSDCRFNQLKIEKAMPQINSRKLDAHRVTKADGLSTSPTPQLHGQPAHQKAGRHWKAGARHETVDRNLIQLHKEALREDPSHHSSEDIPQVLLGPAQTLQANDLALCCFRSLFQP